MLNETETNFTLNPIMMDLNDDSINLMTQIQYQHHNDDRQQQEILRPSNDRVGEIEENLLIWVCVDITLMVLIFSGNTLTILAICLSRRIRSITSNLFILSLAISDMLVGFTLPYHLAFYMGSGLGSIHTWCLMRFFLIIIACCVSIWNLIAIAIDRYIAIVYPLHYVR